MLCISRAFYGLFSFQGSSISLHRGACDSKAVFPKNRSPSQECCKRFLDTNGAAICRATHAMGLGFGLYDSVLGGWGSRAGLVNTKRVGFRIWACISQPCAVFVSNC